MIEKLREFVISRVFNAPRQKVWRAWTDPKLMAKWWGPKGSKVLSSEMDFRPGGTYLYCLQAPGQLEVWGKFVYREIIEPERIVLVTSFSDAEGGITRHPLVANWPVELLSTFIFTEREDKTEVTVNWIPLHPTDLEIKAFEEGGGSMQQGWSGTFDQFAAFLAEST